MTKLKAALFTLIGLLWPSQPPVVNGSYLERRRRLGALMKDQR